MNKACVLGKKYPRNKAVVVTAMSVIIAWFMAWFMTSLFAGDFVGADAVDLGAVSLILVCEVLFTMFRKGILDV